MNKEFSFLYVSLVYNKSDQHNTAFDSYNIELPVTKIKMLTLENAANIYSVFNGVKFGTSDKQEKHLLYPQFVAYL